MFRKRQIGCQDSEYGLSRQQAGEDFQKKILRFIKMERNFDRAKLNFLFLLIILMLSSH
jgi:hypothetical protein